MKVNDPIFYCTSTELDTEILHMRRIGHVDTCMHGCDAVKVNNEFVAHILPDG